MSPSPNCFLTLEYPSNLLLQRLGAGTSVLLSNPYCSDNIHVAPSAAFDTHILRDILRNQTQFHSYKYKSRLVSKTFTQRTGEACRAPCKVIGIFKREVTLDTIYRIELLICRIALLVPDTSLNDN